MKTSDKTKKPILPKKASPNDELKHKELIIQALNEEILRRDRIIEELRKENSLLIKISLKRSKESEDIKKAVQKGLIDKNL